MKVKSRNYKTPDKAFERLVNIMNDLREKCPWDKKQTIETLRNLTIEETYELAEAIMDKNMDNIKKELGDLLLHIVFYSRIASETNDFDITDVINGLCEKLIHRHPHIYSDVKVETAEQVKNNWEKLKLQEGRKSVLEGVPSSLPAMIKASRIQEKMRAVGFDWEKEEEVWGKVMEELNEFKREVDNPAIDGTDKSRIEDEFGDLLFCLINYARFIDVNPENALEKTNRKVIKRFQYLENETGKEGKDLKSMTLAEMDEYWDRAKEIEKGESLG